MADRVLTVRLGADISAYQRAMSQASRSTLSVSGSAQTAGQRIGSAISTGAKVAAAAVVAGAAVGAAKVMEIGMAYEQQMQILQAVSQSTAAKMDEVAVKARQLGSDLEIPGTSAADAAGAMTELAKGGLTVDQAMQAAKGTLQLAAAAQVDGAQAAAIQANALNAFGLQASDAAHVADVLANTANAASGEITDFASGLQQSSAVAASFGISLDDTSTVLGLFANRGIQGSDAGTSFKTMLIAMASPTDKARKALAELGVTTHDAAGNFIGMRTITEQLSAAKGRMTQAEFTAAAATAFGTDAMRAAVVMADGGAAAFDSMSAAVGRQGGAADLSKAQMEGLSGALGVMESATEDVALAFYERFSPAVESAVRNAAERLPKIADAVLDVLDKVAVVATEYGPTVTAALSAGAGDLRRQAEQLLLPLLDGAKDLATQAGPWVVEFGVKLWGAIMKVGDAISPVTSALGNLMSTLANNNFIDNAGRSLSALGSALGVLGSALAPIGEAIGWVVDLIGKIPGELTLGIATFTALALLGPMIQKMLITVLAYLITMPLRLAVNLGIASVAATKFMVALGPVGWAIAAAGAAFAIFAGGADEAGEAAERQRDRIRELTTAIDKNTGAWAKNAEQVVIDGIGPDTMKNLKAAGVSLEDYTKAVLGNADAQRRVDADFQAAGTRAVELSDKWGAVSESMTEAGVSAAEVAAAALSGDWDAVNAKMGDYNAVSKDISASESAKRISETKDSLRLLGAAVDPVKTLMTGLNGESTAAGLALDDARLSAEAAGEGFRMIPEPSSYGWQSWAGVTKEALDGVAKGAGELPVPMSAAEEAVAEYKAAAEEADTASQALQITMDKLQGKTPDHDAMMRLLASSMRDYASSTREIPAALRDQEEATEGIEKAQLDLRKATDELAEAESHLSDGSKEATTADDVARAQLALSDAKRGVADADKAVADAADSVGDAYDKQAEAARKTYESALQVASAAAGAATELGGVAAGADAAAASMQKSRDDFIKTQVAAGMSAAAAADLATKIGLIPDDARTAFLMDTDPALASVDKLAKRLDEIDGKTVTTYANQINRMGTLGDNTSYGSGAYTGGPVPPGYAGGGNPGGGGKLGGTPPTNPSVDNLLAYGPNGKPLRLRSKEWIIKEPTAAAIGDRGMAMFNSGALNDMVRAAAYGLAPGFASGGVPSGASLSGAAPLQYTDRLGRVVGALSDLAAAVDDAAEAYRESVTDRDSARDKLSSVRSSANDANAAAVNKRREAEKKADQVAAEQAKKVAEARAAAARKTTSQAEAQARKITEAEVRLADARNTKGKGRALAVEKAERALTKAREAQGRTTKETQEANARAIEKALAAQAKANAAAALAEKKARENEKKVAAAGDVKFRAAQKDLAAAEKAAVVAKQRADAAAKLEKAQAAQSKRLQTWATAYDSITDKLATARQKADDLRSDRASASASIAGNLAGHGGGITGASELRLDAASIITGQRQNLAQVQTFAANLAKAQAAGLSAKILQEVADAGIDGGGTTAAALAGASSAQIKQINELNSQINAAAKKTGDGVGDALYKSGIQAADGIVAGLKAKQGDVEKAMRRLGEQMAAAMKKALGIKSPSTVMRDQVGVQIVDGVIVGIDSRSAALDAKVSGLVTPPIVSFTNPAEGVVSGARGFAMSAAAVAPPQVNISFPENDALTAFVRDHARVEINGVLVDMKRKLSTAQGQVR